MCTSQLVQFNFHEVLQRLVQLDFSSPRPTRPFMSPTVSDDRIIIGSPEGMVLESFPETLDSDPPMRTAINRMVKPSTRT